MNNTGFIREKPFQADVNKIILQQRGYCGNPTCVQLTGKKQRINITRNEEHKVPKAVYNHLGIPQDPNVAENIWILCAICHSWKTAEDRKLISLCKRYKNDKNLLKNAKGCFNTKTDYLKKRKCLIDLYDKASKKKWT